MASAVRLLAFYFLAVNVIAGAIIGLGIDHTLGIDATIAGEDTTEEFDKSESELETGSPTGSTLFGLYNVVSDQLEGLYGTIYPGLKMLDRAGVPDWIIYDMFGNLASFIIIMGLMSFLRGYST